MTPRHGPDGVPPPLPGARTGAWIATAARGRQPATAGPSPEPAQRIFVGVFPPEAVREDLARTVARLPVATGATGNARLVAPERWHLTLAFLGGISPSRVPEAHAALAAAVRACDVDITVRLAGGGRFGHGVLWAGVRGDVDALARLADTVRRELRRAGLPSDPQPFRPHLTLARPGVRVPLDGDLTTLAGYMGPAWTVDVVHLVHSAPGPTYASLVAVPLG